MLLFTHTMIFEVKSVRSGRCKASCVVANLMWGHLEASLTPASLHALCDFDWVFFWLRIV